MSKEEYRETDIIFKPFDYEASNPYSGVMYKQKETGIADMPVNSMIY